MAATSGGIKAGKAFIVIGAVDKTAMVLGRIGKRFKQFGQKISDMGRGMLTKSLAALTPAALGTKVFASFDDSMRKVEARSSGTAQEMEALREQAKELGRTTSFTASQVGELQAKLSQKGFDRSAIKSMTADVMNLARAAGEGTEEDTVISADVVSGTLRAFQMEANQAKRVSDVFTVAVNNSNFSLQDLNDSMPKAAALASQYNLSLEETVATLASMTNVGVKASEGGNALKTFLARMSDEKKVNKFNKELEALTGHAISFTNESGDLRKPLDILGEIEEATGSLGSAAKGDLLSKLFGVFQFSKAASAAQGRGTAEELLGKLKQASGAAEKTAQDMDAGIGGTFRKLMSAVEGIGIAIGEAIQGPLGSFTDWITTALGPLTEWIAANGEIIATVAAVTAGVGLLGAGMIVAGAAVSGLGAAFGVVASAISLVTGLIGTLLSPLGLVATGVIGIGIALEQTSGMVTSGFGSLTDFLSEQFAWLIDATAKTMGGIMDAIKMGRFDLAFEVAWAGIKLIWASGIQWVMDKVDGLITWLLNAWTNLQFSLSTVMTDLWDGIRLIWFAGIQGLKVLMLTIIEFLTTKIADFIGGLLKKVGKAAQKVPGAKKAGSALVAAGESLEGLAEGVTEQKEAAQKDLDEGVAKIGQENIDKRKELEEERDRILKGREDKNTGKSAERQKKVDDAKVELDKALEAVTEAEAQATETALFNELEGIVNDAEKQSKDGDAQEDPFMKKPGDEKINELEQDGAATTPASVSPGLVKGLEQGTMEALEQANKNAQNKVWNNMLEKQDQQIAATEAVKNAVENKEDVAGV